MSSTGDETDLEIALRPHHCAFEEPDILHLHLHGNIELQHAKATVEFAKQRAGSTGIYLLRDARDAGVIEPAAREYIMRTMGPTTIVATVSYGASFHTQIIVTMVIRAIRAFKKAGPEMYFAATEADARTWIDNHRAKRSVQSS